MKFLTNEEAQMRDEYEKEIRGLKCEIAKLRGQIETLVTVLEFEGVKYSLDDEGNQHFDYSEVKDYRAEQIAEEVTKRLSENWKDVPANPSGFGMKLTEDEIEDVLRYFASEPGSGTCEWTLKERWPNRTGDDHVYGYETGCGVRHTWWPDSLPNYCPSCGGKVKAVKR